MKYLYTAIFLLYLSQGSVAAQEKGGFFDKIKGTFSSEIKIGTHTFKDGSVYTGEMKGRKPNGKGKTVLKTAMSMKASTLKESVKGMEFTLFPTVKSMKVSGFKTNSTAEVSIIL